MLIAVLLVAVGLIFGSFVNALVWRLHEQAELQASKQKNKKAELCKLSIMRGRSMCPDCRHELAPWDLVPLFSWLALKGRCRYCRKPISWQYPTVELVTGMLFALSYLWRPANLQGFGLVQFYFWLVFLVGFVALAVYDLRWFLLPDRIVFPLIGLAIIELLVRLAFYHGGWQALSSSVWGVVIASGLFFVLYRLSDGEWIGGGDVKLGLVLGILLGGPLRSLLLLFIASALGTIVSMPLLAAGKAKRGTLIPFGPFLLAATGIIQLFGGHFVAWINHFTG